MNHCPAWSASRIAGFPRPSTRTTARVTGVEYGQATARRFSSVKLPLLSSRQVTTSGLRVPLGFFKNNVAPQITFSELIEPPEATNSLSAHSTNRLGVPLSCHETAWSAVPPPVFC